MSFKTINPTNGNQEAEFAYITDKELEIRIRKAQMAYQTWGQAPLSLRRDLILQLAEHLRTNQLRYARIITTEMGKPLNQAIAEVHKCAACCTYFAEHAEEFLADKIVKTSHKYSAVAYHPLGVIYIIMPWNFPFWQVIRCAVPALLAGNTIILKHAENVPQCAMALDDAFHKAGLADGIFQSVFITHKQSDDIIASPQIRGVSLTGSGRAGRAVAAQAGNHLKKCVLELGGSDPFIVLADADIEKAVETAVQARMQNTGQSCIAAKRFILHKDISEKFTEAFVAKVQSLKVGSPFDEDVEIGPMARADLRDDLHKQVLQSVEAGAHILTGGKMLDGEGFYYEPTVLNNIPPRAAAYKEELFGPVASLFTVSTDEEAILLANDTTFGLGASLWTKDEDKALKYSERLNSGSVFINAMVKSDPQLPFGGVKDSGFGRELSEIGMHEFVNIKTVVIG